MLKLKINKKDIEIVEEEYFVRGTVGAKCAITAIDEYWMSNEHLFDLIPFDPQIQESIDVKETGISVALVFKRNDMSSIKVYLIDYREDTNSLETFNAAFTGNDKARNESEYEVCADIPYEVMANKGRFKVGFFMSLYYVYTDDDGNVVENVATTPTLWSENISVKNGTDTDGTTATQYTPTELEQLNGKIAMVDSKVSDKQDKLTAGKNITIENNVISAKGADQIYNANSKNAQSGTAVAEAMGVIETKIKENSDNISKAVFKTLRADATDPMAYNNEDSRVPYMYGVYGDSDGNEQQGLIKGSTGKLRKQMAEPFKESDPEIYQSIIEGRISSEQVKLLDPHTIAIRDGNCAVPVGLHIYDEDKDGNITNSQLFYSAATPQSYVQHLFATLKTITTVGVVAGCKYTFDWNAMYFLKSNTGKTDITLLDSDGNNIIGSLKCSYGLLILPKASYVRSEWTSKYDPSNPAYDDGKVYEDGNRKEDKLHGLFAGYTDKTAIITTDKIQMLQFDLDPDKTVSVTPTAESVIVYKIKF